MSTEATLQTGNAQIDGASLQYPPGWIDRLVRWINRLPISALVLYPILLAVLYLLVNAARWLEGSAPFGSLDAPYAFAVFYPVWGLASLHYLDLTAGRAFDYFKPALGKGSAEAARLCYQLTTVPEREAGIVAVAGLLFTVVIWGAGNGWRPILGGGLYFWTVLAVTAAGFVMTAELIFHTVRQLRLVSAIHASAENINLYHYGPLYAFSGLSARTGIVFVLSLTVDAAVNPETFSNAPLFAMNAFILVLSVACFVLPLRGMHHRIIVEKRRLQWDVDQRLAAIVQHLYGKVDDLDLHDADSVNKTIASLIATRDLLAKIPTWPWRPETITGFSTALTLPVVVFLIQMFLKNLIGLK